MAKALTEWLNEALGPHTLVGRPSMTARRAGTAQSVVQVRDASGHSWFVKQPQAQRAWRSEVHAYRAWVPAIAERAPRLHAADEELRALVVSALPGISPLHRDLGAVRQAGQVLRRLHGVEVTDTGPFRAPRPMPQRLDKLLRRNAGLFTAEEAGFARRSAERATRLPPVPLMACHGDYNSHNWILDDAGTLRIIDFGEARLHRAASDFTKLFYGPWWHRPRLAGSFFKGYGRRPDAHDMEFIQCRMAVSAIAEVCFGRNRSNPEAEKRGRSRLSDLMDGYQVKVARRYLRQPRR